MGRAGAASPRTLIMERIDLLLLLLGWDFPCLGPGWVDAVVVVVFSAVVNARARKTSEPHKSHSSVGHAAKNITPVSSNYGL